MLLAGFQLRHAIYFIGAARKGEALWQHAMM